MNTEILNQLKETLGMFLFLAVELTLLFLIISFFIGLIQEKMTPERVKSILSSKNGKGYVISALLGSITPFCSCSTIPFLQGLLRAKAGFGPTIVFLIASPLLNPIIIGLFFATFGVKVTLFYFVSALLVSITSGYLLEILGFERYVREGAYGDETSSCN